MRESSLLLCFKVGILLVLLLSDLSLAKKTHKKGRGKLKLGRLRVMLESGAQYHFRQKDCPSGLWTEKAFEKDPIKCICVKGTFLAAENACSQNFFVLTGNEHCFDAEHMSSVNKFFPLLGPTRKDSTISLFGNDAPYVVHMNTSMRLKTDEPMGFAVRHRSPKMFASFASGSTAEEKKALQCFQDKSKSRKTVVELLALTSKGCPSIFESAGHKKKMTGCKKLGFSESMLTLNVGQMYDSKRQTITQGSAFPECKSSKQVRSRKTNKFQISDIALRTCKAPKTGRRMKGRAFAKTPPNTPLADMDMNGMSAEDRRISEQSIKVFRQLAKFQFENVAGPKASTPEYKFVQLAKKVMHTVCPKEYIPLDILNFFVRAFRMLFVETLQTYPYTETTDKDQFEAIVNALSTCAEKAEPVSFVDTPNNTKKKKKDGGKNKCNKRRKIYFTKVADQVYQVGKNLTQLPFQLRFNLKKRDMPVETVWKMLNLVHYHCWDHFKSGFDHSEMEVKFEALLSNKYLISRWSKPGKATRLFKSLLPKADLRLFADSLDKCVETAYTYSPYKRWLKRPTISIVTEKPSETPTRRKRSVVGSTKKIWDDKAFCLKKYSDLETVVKTPSLQTCTHFPVWP